MNQHHGGFGAVAHPVRTARRTRGRVLRMVNKMKTMLALTALTGGGLGSTVVAPDSPPARMTESVISTGQQIVQSVFGNFTSTTSKLDHRR